MTDRHRQPKLTIRATAQQIEAWRAAAGDSALNAWLVRALDSHVASQRTARLRLTKTVNRITRQRGESCSDPHCSLPADHDGRCDFLRTPE